MPVMPSTMVSTGPPLLQAMTGFPAAIASSGTISKMFIFRSVDHTRAVAKQFFLFLSTNGRQ